MDIFDFIRGLFSLWSLLSVGCFGGVIISLLQCGTTGTDNIYNCNIRAKMRDLTIHKELLKE